MSGSVSVSTESPYGVGGMQNQDGDADMLVDTGVSVPGASRMSDEAVIPTPEPVPQRPAEASIVASTASIVRPPAVQPNIVADNNARPSTQPAPSSTQTPSEPPAATQPLVCTSSRPFIAPPRVPRPATPMSLVEVLNQVWREKLQSLEAEGRELGRRRSNVDPTGGSSHFILLFSFSSSHLCSRAPERLSWSERSICNHMFIHIYAPTALDGGAVCVAADENVWKSAEFERDSRLDEAKPHVYSYLHVHTKVYVQRPWGNLRTR